MLGSAASGKRRRPDESGNLPGRAVSIIARTHGPAPLADRTESARH